jgi:hypothetical protein
LFRNKLSGSIPEKLSSCQSLHTLDIASNKLACIVLTSIGLLTIYEYLPLARNLVGGSLVATGLALQIRVIHMALAMVAWSLLRMAAPTKPSSFVFVLLTNQPDNKNGSKRHLQVPFRDTNLPGFSIPCLPFPVGQQCKDGPRLLFESWVQVTSKGRAPIIDIWGNNMEDVSAASASKETLLS